MLSGLAKQHAILGMDFVREQQLCIEADNVFFKKFPLEESVSCSTLTAPEDFSVSTRTVLRTELFVRTAHGTPIPSGTSGVSSTAWDEVGVWDTLNTVDSCGTVSYTHLTLPTTPYV